MRPAHLLVWQTRGLANHLPPIQFISQPPAAPCSAILELRCALKAAHRLLVPLVAPPPSTSSAGLAILNTAKFFPNLSLSSLSILSLFFLTPGLLPKLLFRLSTLCGPVFTFTNSCSSSSGNASSKLPIVVTSFFDGLLLLRVFVTPALLRALERRRECFISRLSRFELWKMSVDFAVKVVRWVALVRFVGRMGAWMC